MKKKGAERKLERERERGGMGGGRGRGRDDEECSQAFNALLHVSVMKTSSVLFLSEAILRRIMPEQPGI